MARPVSEHPTELELLILKVLWERSPLPVREIRQALAEQGRDLAHTSVITTLNIMVRKGYLKRKKDGKAYPFSPRLGQDEVSQKMLGDIVDRVFDGSATSVVLSLFNCSEVDTAELKELRRLIDQQMKKQS